MWHFVDTFVYTSYKSSACLMCFEVWKAHHVISEFVNLSYIFHKHFNSQKHFFANIL